MALSFVGPAIAQQQHLPPGASQERRETIDEMEARSRKGPSSNALRQLSVASNNFDVHFYRCEWSVDPAVKYINGKVTVYFTMLTTANSIKLDLQHQLTVDSLIYHGVKRSAVQTPDEGLTIGFPSNIAAKPSILYRSSIRACLRAMRQVLS